MDGLIDDMESAGLAPDEKIFFDGSGKLNRYTISGDKKNSKNGWYIFHNDDLPVCVFGSWKTGQTIQWRNGSKAELTTQQQDKIEAAKIQRDKARIEVYAAAKIRANEIWGKSDHRVELAPYLINKRINNTFNICKYSKKSIIVPVTNICGGIESLQFISETGEKMFLSGGKVAGNFCAIGSVGGDMILCEGLVTGITIHEATGKNVIVAFNASNLKPVFDALSKKYKNSDIVIAADNDQFRNGGNIGVEKAKSCGCPVAIPEFQDLSTKPTDFNDLYVLQGIDAVKLAFSGNSKTRQEWADLIDFTNDIDKLLDVITIDINNSKLSAPIKATLIKQIARKCGISIETLKPSKTKPINSDWEKQLIIDERPLGTIANVFLILTNDKNWSGKIKFNVFNLTCYLIESPNGFSDGEWRDIDDSRLAVWLSNNYDGMNVKSSTISETIFLVANNNKFHPVQDYFNSVTWDRKPRIKNWLHDYLKAENNNYTSSVGECFLISAVARIFSAGCKVDNVMILEGKQAAKKSTALEIMGGEWYIDTNEKLGTKDSYIVIQGYLIAELGELSSFRGSESAGAKQFFSKLNDVYRPPYARRSISVPRSCVFVGTTNDDQYLDDETGNRRYWPILCGDIDVDSLRRDRDQLWAEAVEMYKSDIKWWFENNGEAEQQDSRMVIDPWTEVVAHYIKDKKKVTSAELLSDHGCLNMVAGQWTVAHEKRVSAILKRMGFKRQTIRINGVIVKGFIKM